MCPSSMSEPIYLVPYSPPAKLIDVCSNGMGLADIDVGNFTAVLIQAADGEFVSDHGRSSVLILTELQLVSEFASGAKVTVSFPENGATQFVDPTGGLISSFTSYGPTNDFHFKPAVAAPGGNILSTFPVPLGSFAVLSWPLPSLLVSLHCCSPSRGLRLQSGEVLERFSKPRRKL